MSTLDVNRQEFEDALKALLLGLEYSTILPARLTIINYVKAKLDELIPEGEGVSYALSTDPNISDPLDLLINVHLDEATKDVILSAPLTALTPVKLATASGTPFTDATTGYIDLPTAYLRFYSLKMQDWIQTVTYLRNIADPVYKRQSNPHMKAGIYKPEAFLTWRTSGATVVQSIEYYSVVSSHVITALNYIGNEPAEDFAARSPILLDSLAWMCAAKIMQITGMMDASVKAMEQVKLSYNGLL